MGIIHGIVDYKDTNFSWEKYISDNQTLYKPKGIDPELYTPKTWGFEVIDSENSTNSYLVKYLAFLPYDQHSSLHFHKNKNEFFYVLHGNSINIYNYLQDKNLWDTGEVLINNEEYFIKIGKPHMFIKLPSGTYEDIDPTWYDINDSGLKCSDILIEVSFYNKEFSSLKELIAFDKQDNVKLFPAGQMDKLTWELPKILNILNKPETEEDELLV